MVKPAFIVAGDSALAGGARLVAPEAQVRLQSFTEAPAMDPAMATQPGLVIWKADEATTSLPPPLGSFLTSEGLPNEGLEIHTIEVPYLFSGGKQKAIFGFAWIN
jgi:hypothetical protein